MFIKRNFSDHPAQFPKTQIEWNLEKYKAENHLENSTRQAQYPQL